MAAGLALLVLAVPSYAENAAPQDAAAMRANDGAGRDITSIGAPAGGWTEAPGPVIVNMPFMFAAGDTVLPPGKYTVTVDNDDPTLVRLVSANGHNVATLYTVLSRSTTDGTKAHFAFKEYGQADYVLSAVSLPGDSVRVVPLSKRQVTRELEKLAMARLKSQPRG